MEALNGARTELAYAIWRETDRGLIEAFALFHGCRLVEFKRVLYGYLSAMTGRFSPTYL